jgi:preprotein translocase subunit SecF
LKKSDHLELIAALPDPGRYSVNDTIVSFDRIRENRGENVPATLRLSTKVSTDPSRTILTSLAR